MIDFENTIKIIETLKSFLPPSIKITDHAGIHHYLRINLAVRDDLLRKLAYQTIPDQIVNEYFELLSKVYKEKCAEENLKKILNASREVCRAMENLEDIATQLIRYWEKDYIYIGYSGKHQRHALIDKESFSKFNYKVNLIRENMDMYHLTYIKNLTDLKIEIK
jgi:hypothetical protein